MKRFVDGSTTKEDPTPKKFLGNKQAAGFLGCSVSKLNKSRSDGKLGIPFFKNGNQVLYEKADLIEWLESRKHVNTSEYQTHPGPGRGHKKETGGPHGSKVSPMWT